MAEEPQNSPHRTQSFGTEATGDFIPGGSPDTLDLPRELLPAVPMETLDPPSQSGIAGSVLETIDRPAGQSGSVFQGQTEATLDGPHESAANRGQQTGKALPGTTPIAPQVRSSRYIMKRFHARGGMGEVWLAEDCDINRPVAMKKMRGGRPDQKERFLIEAQITGQLEHPGVVPIHELGLDEKGQPFYVMKFIQGRTMKEALEDYHQPSKPQDVPPEVQYLRLLESFINLCHTVAFAHSRGVIHRDLKPENVMVGAYGETLLLDWGLAKVLGGPDEEESPPLVRLKYSGNSAQSEDGVVRGTPSYMAPESAEGRTSEVDAKTDIYLLGATLYHLITGKRPREGSNLSRVLEEARSKPPVSPRALVRTIPKSLEAICMKAMAIRKEDRYDSAAVLAEDMQRFVAGEPVSAYREGLLERTWRWARKHKQLLGWSAAALLVAGLVVLGGTKVREAQETARLAQEESEHEKALKQASDQVDEFHRLAEEMRFFAASTDPMSENTPFFDPHKGEALGEAALAVAQPWGARLDQLPLEKKREPLGNELYDLLVLMAQTHSQQPGKPAETAEAVLALLERAAPLHQPTRSFYRLRGQAYELLGDHPRAVEQEQLANNANTPATALDHFLQAEQYRIAALRPADADPDRPAWKPDSEEMTKAVEWYRRALSVDPDHFWSLYQLGRCYLSQGKAAEAAEALRACIALRPKEAWGYSARALALSELKLYPEALADLDRALLYRPDFRPPQLTRGVVYWKQKNYKAAQEDFEAVLQPPAEQRLIEAAFYRGQMEMDQEHYGAALENFAKVVEAKRSIRMLHKLRAQIYLTLGKIDEALGDLDAFLGFNRPSYDPNSAEAHAQRGHLLRLLMTDIDPRAWRKMVPATHAQLQKAVNSGLDKAAVFDDLGAILELQKKFDEAIKAYGRGLVKEPKNLKLLVKRGWAWEKLPTPRYDKAEADFEAATKIDPTHAEAYAGLGYIQACRKLPAEARRHANLAMLNGAGDYLVLHNLACLYAKLYVTDSQRANEYEDMVVDQLRRSVELWRRDKQGPSELVYIKNEGTFVPLKNRPKFKEFLKQIEE